MEAIALKLETIVLRLEAIALRVEAVAIAIRLEAISLKLEAITAIGLKLGHRPSVKSWRPSLAIAIRGPSLLGLEA